MAGERTLPGIGLTGFWTPGSDGWDAAMDVNWRLLSAVAQLTVISRTTALPGSPTDGNIYIVPSGAGSHPNEVAIRDSGAWVYVTPKEGWLAYIQDTDSIVTWNGSAWTGTAIEVTGSVAGAPTSSQVVLRRVFGLPVVFADEFAGSYASAGTAATASTTFTVKKNGSSVGTIVFAAAGTTGTWSTTGTTVSFAAGDLLEIVAPASADATLAAVAFTVVGVR